MNLKERGQAYVLILVLLGIGGLLLIPFLRTASTVVSSRTMYSQFILEDYAADAAVEYGMWRLKHEPGFADSLPIGQESDPFYVTLNGITANTTVMAQALEYELSGQELAGRADGELFFKVEKTVVATTTYATLAADDFEDFWCGSGSCGSGAWTGNWGLSGSYSFTTSGEHEGSYCLLLVGDDNGSPGDGYAEREANLSGSSGLGPYLTFWAKVREFESYNNDEAYVKVSTDGENWDILRTFQDGDDDNQYHQYQYDLSGYGAPSSFYVAFETNLSSNYDYFYIDDVRFTNAEETTTIDPGVETLYTYYVSIQCVDPDGCTLDRIVDELPKSGATDGDDYLQYVAGSTDWDVVSYDSFAYDGFETSGSTGSWIGGWTTTGDCDITTYGEFEGDRCLRLRGDGDSYPGDGYARRAVDLSGTTGSGPYLYFWARINEIESGDTIDVNVSTNGADWDTLETFDYHDDDNQYHQYWYDLSDYGRPSTFYLAFEMNGNHDSDTFYVDAVEFSNYQGAVSGEWPVPPFDPTDDGVSGYGSGRYQWLEWDFEDRGYYDIDFDYGEIRTMSFQAEAALDEDTYCNHIWVSNSSQGDEGEIVSGTTAKITVGEPEETNCDDGKIVVTKVSDPEVVYPYEPTTVIYTITIENVDTEDVRIYAVEDWLPATGSTVAEEGFIYVDNSASGRIIRPLSLAYDGLESGSGSGGTGNWVGNWTFSGDYSVTTNGNPYQGNYHLRLRGDQYPPPGDGYARRTVDLSGYSDTQLRFWAKASEFESGDEVYILGSTNPPTYTDIAFDGFESGDGSGGTGTWNGNWTFSGDYSVTSYDYPYEGSRHLRLQYNDGYARRQADLSGYSNAELHFYAKLYSLESGDEVDILVSTNGADWDTLDTFDDQESDNQYHLYEYDLSGYGSPSTFYIAFDSNMSSGSGDYFWVDNVELVDNGGGYWDVLDTIADGDDDGQYHRYTFDLSGYGSPSTFYIAFDASGLSSDQDYFYVDDVEFLDPNAESETLVCMPDEDNNPWEDFMYEDWEYHYPYWQYRWSITWDFDHYPNYDDPVWDEGGACDNYTFVDYDPYLLLHPGEIFEITFQAEGTLTYSGSYFNEVFVKIYEGGYYEDDEWVYSWPTGTVIVPQYDLEAETLNSVLRANALLSPDGHWWRSWHWWYHR